MPQYQVDVAEHRIVRMRYTVTARSVKEANEKAENGETDAEEHLKDQSIEDRTRLTEAVRLKKKEL